MQKELTRPFAQTGVIAFCLLLLSSCVHKGEQSAAVPPVPVHVQVVTAGAPSPFSRYVGTVEAFREIPLSSQMAGRVLSVEVKDGERVRKGQVLLMVDSTQAVNAVRSAKATYRQAKDGYERAKQVYSKGAVTDQKMVEIESQLLEAQSLYEAAKQRLAECTLTAPGDGIIDGLDAVVGQTIIPGNVLCRLLDVRTFSVRFTVPEAEVGKLKVESGKLKGTVECAAVEKTLPIVITETGITANPLTHTYEVIARIQGGADVLLAGMVGTVQITNYQSPITNYQSPITNHQSPITNHQSPITNHQSPITNDNIVIPAKCILLKPAGHTVWLLESGQAVRREITIDGYQADGVRVLSGLHEGDTLIVEGYQKLYEGCKVENK